ncbi:MAG: PKD domain-containing protein [Sphingobacteriales bacterium]|nr:MAG: PKD domain-containing protein [Sphingobacteriales bacterium]
MQGLCFKNKSMYKSAYLLILLLFYYSVAKAQNKYYEKTKNFGALTQSAGEIHISNDSIMAIWCGTHQTVSANEKTFLLLTDINLDNIEKIDYGYDVGEFVILSMITTPYGYAICGWTTDWDSSNYGYPYLLEVDHEGNILNNYDLREFPYEGNAIALLYYPETNTYYIGGDTWYSGPNTQMMLIKMTNGEVVWRRYYDDYDHRNFICDLLPTPDGGVYAVGTIDSWNGYYFGNYYLMKIAPDGTTEWDNVYSIGFEDLCTDALLLSDGGFLISGGSNIPNPINNNKLYPTLLRLDTARNVVWDKLYFPNAEEGGILKCYQISEHFVCVGSIKSEGSDYIQAFIMKVRGSDGEPLWTRFYDYGVQHDYFYNFTPVPQPLGGFVCVGRTEPASGADVYIVKTNCMGLLTMPEAAFTTEQDPDVPSRFQFTNQSQYTYPDSIDGGYYVLNWGDGSPPFICGQGHSPCIQDTLIHTYQTEGIYGITLQAIVCNDTSTQIQSICFGFAPNPQAEFSYQDFGGAIIFTNLSQNAYIGQGGYYLWDFGDGSPPSSAEHPTHEYEENGSYTVTLTLVVCGDTSVYTQEVVVQTVGNTPLPLSRGEFPDILQVYPNPAQNTLTFAFTEGLTPPSGGWGVEGDLGVTEGSDIAIKLLSLTGQTVLETTFTAGETSKTVSVAHLPEGVYVYVVEYGGAVLVRGKVAVMR